MEYMPGVSKRTSPVQPSLLCDVISTAFAEVHVDSKDMFRLNNNQRWVPKDAYSSLTLSSLCFQNWCGLYHVFDFGMRSA